MSSAFPILIIIASIVIIGGAAALIIWVIKNANAKYDQLWAPLRSIVGGTSKGAKMIGSYQGVPVQALITSTGDESSTSYSYELQTTPGGRGKDWAVTYGGEKMFGLGQKTWHLDTKDEALKERLRAEGVVEIMEHWASNPTVSYKAKKGILLYRLEVPNAYAVPDAPTFQAQLDLLSQFAKINNQVNYE